MREQDFLICPICGGKLTRCDSSVVCDGESGKRHCFDISRSGYCDLSHRSGGGGDPKDAVNDRTDFLNKGYYSKLADEICRLCLKYTDPEGLVVDCGCGEGYYSEQLAELFGSGFVFGADLSKHAVHRASVRRNMRGGTNSFYAVASVFELPLRDGCADCCLSMFAPIAQEQILRVLRDGGILIVGSAAPRHLLRFKEAIYDEVYLNEERADLPPHMELIERTRIEYTTLIDNNKDLLTLFGMTPYRFRTSRKAFERLCSLESLLVDVEVDFSVYRKPAPH